MNGRERDDAIPPSRLQEQLLADLQEMTRLVDECAGRLDVPSLRDSGGNWRHKVKVMIMIVLAPMLRVYLQKQIRLNHLLVHTTARLVLLEQRLARLEAASQGKD